MESNSVFYKTTGGQMLLIVDDSLPELKGVPADVEVVRITLAPGQTIQQAALNAALRREMRKPIGK